MNRNFVGANKQLLRQKGGAAMVIYYSSTGNSKHVALRLHKAFQGKLIDVCDFEGPATFYLEDGETLFLSTALT